MSADAHHITAPPEDGRGAARSMANALRNGRLDAADIHYINAHGTSTPLGDVAECVAVRRTFGAPADRLAVSSTKSMTGHLLGAAGGVEAVFTVLALRDQVAPPTANLFNRDPKCDLDFVPLVARPMRIAAALSNSFGFGGTNATLAFRTL
jgi:3-oxoacyl-[acyl-carrier-protein] synthase II